MDAATFRQGMSRLAAGVNVITVRDAQGGSRGMTATAFCSVSAEPPQVLVCINRSSRTHALIEEAGAYGVSVLDAGATEISARCAAPGGVKDLERAWLNEGSGSASPMVAGALVHLDCVVVGHHAAGTHSIFVGQVRGVHHGSGEDPLVYFAGEYRRVTAIDPGDGRDATNGDP